MNDYGEDDSSEDHQAGLTSSSLINRRMMNAPSTIRNVPAPSGSVDDTLAAAPTRGNGPRSGCALRTTGALRWKDELVTRYVYLHLAVSRFDLMRRTRA
jgi:hypothetical protein